MAKEEEDYIDEEMDDPTIYDEGGREGLVDDDEMSAEEEGFMRGYEAADEREDEIDAEETKEE